MFLKNLNANDERFKSFSFHEGLNILVADRTDKSDLGDSRNSVGKTSFVKVIRYLLGGNLPAEFRIPELQQHVFQGILSLPGRSGNDVVTVARKVSPTTKLQVEGWSWLESDQVHVDEWRAALAQHVFNIPSDAVRPTVGQLWGQLIRDNFGKPIQTHASESLWESGARVGFLLGLSSETLGGAKDVHKLEKQSRAISQAVKEGALSHLSLDEPQIRAELASTRRRRDALSESLKQFKVDEQYSEHQLRADELSATIKRLNDQALIARRRATDLREAIQEEESNTTHPEELVARLESAYSEVNIIFPELVSRRFDEVAEFHDSILRNRQLFLRDELEEIDRELSEIESLRHQLDNERSQIMALLAETVALDTFITAQRDLASLDSLVLDLERRLDSAASANNIDDQVRLKKAQLVSSIRREISERDQFVEDAINLFRDLGSEIYSEREASLLIAPNENGALKVEPKISGDAGDGVRNVATFILDMVCLIQGIKLNRAPKILVHDSHLFDSIDARQAASCMRIGARLAEEYDFQYIVTMNSDFLDTVTNQSEGAFDPEPYILTTRLTDKTEDGRLFGFRFD